jgi:hypothetical protein
MPRPPGVVSVVVVVVVRLANGFSIERDIARAGEFVISAGRVADLPSLLSPEGETFWRR